MCHPDAMWFHRVAGNIRIVPNIRIVKVGHSFRAGQDWLIHRAGTRHIGALKQITERRQEDSGYRIVVNRFAHRRCRLDVSVAEYSNIGAREA